MTEKFYNYILGGTNNAKNQIILCKWNVNKSACKKEWKKQQKKKEKKWIIKAYPILDMERLIGEADVAIAWTAGGYQLTKAKEICNASGVPVDVIPMSDYGMCNGMNVLKFAFKLSKK